MELDLVLIGFLVGTLVGMTGMGGGSLTTPILILFADVRPVIAVGSDLAYSVATKWLGAAIHHRQGTIHLPIVLRLAAGSIPGTLVGVWLLQTAGLEDTADRLVTRALGVTLLLIAVSLFVGRRFRQRKRPRVLERNKDVLTILLGFFVGLLLGITSVGSGTIVMAVLLLVTRSRPGAQLVGIDVLHGAILVTVAAIAHWSIGTIDWGITGALLVGSLPGVTLGSLLAPRVPEPIFRPFLGVVLLVAGGRLLI